MSPSEKRAKKAAKAAKSETPVVTAIITPVAAPAPTETANLEAAPLPVDYPRPSPVVHLDNSAPVTTRAFHEFQARQNAKIRELRAVVEKLSESLAQAWNILMSINESISTMSDALDAILTRIEALEAGAGDPGAGDGNYPAAVNSLATLKQFVSAHFGPTALTQQFDGPSKKMMCASIRNALATRYPATIKRLNDDPIGNGYHPSETKHSDAFWYVPDATVIDFCSASDAPGTLNSDLTWRREPINPW